jgi:excisionase family DNA binding protein
LTAEVGQFHRNTQLSIQEVADRYEVSKQTVHNWINKGTIKGFKQGKGRYFHMDEIEKSFAQYRYSDVLERKGLKEPGRKIY